MTWIPTKVGESKYGYTIVAINENVDPARYLLESPKGRFGVYTNPWRKPYEKILLRPQKELAKAQYVLAHDKQSHFHGEIEFNITKDQGIQQENVQNLTYGNTNNLEETEYSISKKSVKEVYESELDIERVKAIFNDEMLGQLCIDLKDPRKFKGDLNKYCYPFIPWVGKDYWNKHENKQPRIMYVGKACNKWDTNMNPPKTLNDFVWKKPKWNWVKQERGDEIFKESTIFNVLARLTDGYITDAVKKDFVNIPSNSNNYKETGRSLMAMIYRMTRCIFNTSIDYEKKLAELIENEPNSQLYFDSIVWTNLFKITKSAGGNPDKGMRDFLSDNFMTMTLKKEIEDLEPDIIVFTTGYDYDQYLKKLFSDLVLEEIPNFELNKAAELKGVSDMVIVVRTRHPQGWELADQELICKYLQYRMAIS